jgi:hypothetical protein
LLPYFAIRVVDTGGKLPPVSLTPVVHLDLRISPQISKKFETVLMGHSGAGGKLTHEKTRSKKSRDTVPLIDERDMGTRAMFTGFI